MDTYKSDIQQINRPVSEVYNRLAHPGNLHDKISQLPPEVQEKLKGVVFDDSSVTFDAPTVGKVKLNVTERIENQRISLEPEGLPIQLTGSVVFNATAENASSLQIVLDIDLPFFVKAMAGNKISDGINQLASTLAKSLA